MCWLLGNNPTPTLFFCLLRVCFCLLFELTSERVCARARMRRMYVAQLKIAWNLPWNNMIINHKHLCQQWITTLIWWRKMWKIRCFFAGAGASGVTAATLFLDYFLGRTAGNGKRIHTRHTTLHHGIRARNIWPSFISRAIFSHSIFMCLQYSWYVCCRWFFSLSLMHIFVIWMQRCCCCSQMYSVGRTVRQIYTEFDSVICDLRHHFCV